MDHRVRGTVGARLQVERDLSLDKFIAQFDAVLVAQ